MSLTPTVTPPEQQQLAKVRLLRPAAYREPSGEVVPLRHPQPPTYDAQILRDGLEAAKQSVRELQHHLTEAELNPGQRPADLRAAQSRQRAIALAREHLDLRQRMRARNPS